MRNRITMLLMLSVLLSVLSFGARVANAGTGLSIQPVKVSHTINPGETISDIIYLTNASEEDVKVEVTVEDFIPAVGSVNISFVGRAEGLTTVRDWIIIGEKDSFVFKKGESRAIPYTVKAPKNAEPGGHFGVAFFKASKLQEAEQLKISTRIGMLIFVTVPGNNLQKGKILNFTGPKFVQKGPVAFEIKFENTGTVHFEPKGKIKIKNVFGKEIASIPVEGQVVLPTGVRDLNASWFTGWLFGKYKADLNIIDGEGNNLSGKSISFYAFPIWYLAGFIAATAAIFFGFKYLRKKVKFSVSINK